MDLRTSIYGGFLDPQDQTLIPSSQPDKEIAPAKWYCMFFARSLKFWTERMVLKD